jgi:hypothetical protein
MERRKKELEAGGKPDEGLEERRRAEEQIMH